MELDTEQVAREFIRALRGRRSQNAFSRRLGYRTNVLYMWEAGRTYPTASVALRAAERAGIDVGQALSRFYRVAPSWLERTTRFSRPAAVQALLDDLRADRSIVDVAAAFGRSRFATARILHGDAEPRLPDFFRLIEVMTLRLLDFIAAFVEPRELPSLAEAWERVETSRRAAYEMPWTHAILRVLELVQYRALPAHEPGFIAEKLGIERAEEERCLALLEQTGQIRREGSHFVPAAVLTVDTRRDQVAALALRRFWTRVALERVPRDDGHDVFAFNLATVAERDVERIRALHRRYFNELRALIAESEPAEAVLLANVQLIRLV